MKTRIESNQKLLSLLQETLCKYPQLRFIQALIDLEIIEDESQFYEESEATVARLKRKGIL